LDELDDTTKSLAKLDISIPQDYSVMRDSSIPGKGRNDKYTQDNEDRQWNDALDVKMSPEELNIHNKRFRDFHEPKGKPK